jgi:hypothetical protein
VDGTAGSWVTIFAYGAGVYGNSSIAGCPEIDNTDIPHDCGSATLINGTGVGIDIDGIAGITPGTNYNYIRIISPGNGGSDGSDVDAIQIIP